MRESTAAEPFVEPDHLHVFDSGTVRFSHLSKILDLGSHLPCNPEVKVNFTATGNRELTP